MLKIDFYESGKGETIVLTFPDGGLGIVDAHPSRENKRPPISQLVNGAKIHFVCLTHPHEDHGLDLHKAIEAASEVGSYWHTVTDIQAIQYAVTQQSSFPSRFNSILEVMRKEWAYFLVDLYYEVGRRDDKSPGFIRKINAMKRTEKIGNVNIHFLGPSEAEQNKYVSVYRDRLLGKHRRKPDENALSAILAVEYSGNLILLGADALNRNWKDAVEIYRKDRLPKAAILKVPHHGGRSSLSLGKKSSYLRLCKTDNTTTSVLFAGDAKHPHDLVQSKLKACTQLQCIANGRKDRALSNPLKLNIPGAIAVANTVVCNSHIGFQLNADGSIIQTAGVRCEFCS